jgi:tRNA (guanine37-N1)-methyltransferase
MHVGVVTLFPELIEQALQWGVIGQAKQRGLWSVSCVNPRDFTNNPRKSVDDRPYGGGPGMVMSFEPLYAAILEISRKNSPFCAAGIDGKSSQKIPRRIFLSPSGQPFNQAKARELSTLPAITLVCGRYEGIDERVIESEIDECISVGDFVLSGGEFAALAVIDAVTRLLPGVLGDSQSAQQESFSFGLLDHPHYTRPEVLPDGRAVPAELLSGNHERIALWRAEQARARTEKFRPDLLQNLNIKPPKH